MLDENLPTFVLKASKEKPKQNSTFFYSQFGNDFEPAYTLKHIDPEQHASRNRYAVALYDAYNPDVLFGEVLLIPEWTQPTLSQDEIRRNGGVTPAPEPILPLEFCIQLYNPDQQIVVEHKPASLTTNASWQFEVPQQSFRTPSHSQLDRSQSDPTISEFTPKLKLKWKKDGRLSKDLGCYLSGRASNPDGNKGKHKEPDITIAIFKNLKEMTMYEPNMTRVEVEDLKGFEVALLLGAVVIRDVYFGSTKETFNIQDGRKGSATSPVSSTISGSLPPSQPLRQTATPVHEPRIPPTDPRSQWEIDQETERLRRQTAEEERKRKKLEEAEQRQIKKMLEQEEKEQRRKQAEIDAETERLRKLYGQQNAVPQIRVPQSNAPRHQSYSGPSASAYASQASLVPTPYMSGAAPQSALLQPHQQKLKPKSSGLFSFRRHSDQESNKLYKKKSAMW